MKATADNYKLLAGFVLAWITINIFQSSVTGLYPDEAYYWIFSKNLQWGYFDHPPLVALIIRLGEIFGHGSFYTRIGSVLLSAGSIFFLYKSLPPSLADVRLFIICFLSVAIFHVYGFIATPDGPLFFFTCLFFYAYRKYLERVGFKNCLLVSVAIIGMLYSKYHGVLPVLLVLLSNPKLVFRSSAWGVVGVVVFALLPHVYWQYVNEWPTPKYHLYDRVASAYHLSKTTNYILGQLLIWGLITAIPAIYCIFCRRRKDLYLKAHYYTMFGVLVFFFVFSFKSSIEPHWTLVAGPSFIVLLVVSLQQLSDKFKKIFTRLALANIFLILLARLFLFIPDTPMVRSSNLKPLFYGKLWADSIYKYAGSTPVVFIDSYALPSLYSYYHPDVESAGVNSINYRKNHFSITDDEIKLNNKKAFVQVGRKIDSADYFISTPYTNTYLHLVDSFKALGVLNIEWLDRIKEGKPGEEIEIVVSIINDSEQPIDVNQDLKLNYSFFKTRKERFTSSDFLLTEDEFLPGQQVRKRFTLKLPLQPGNYRLVFSLKYFPLESTLASHYYDVAVR